MENDNHSIFQQSEPLDRAALGKLWTANRRLWCHIAFAMTGDPDAVDEIVQDAFRKMLASQRGWGSERESLNYFKKVVVHCAVDYLKNLRWLRSHQVHFPAAARVRDADPEEQALAGESLRLQGQLIEAVLACWHRLSAQQREALHEVLLHGVPLREFSRRRNLPVNTARSRLLRGLQLLRNLLHRKGLLPVTVVKPNDNL